MVNKKSHFKHHIDRTELRTEVMVLEKTTKH